MPTPVRSLYATRIAALLPGEDPRHVEAYMRLEFGTLDALTPAGFRAAVSEAAASVQADRWEAEKLARSYGLMTTAPTDTAELTPEQLLALADACMEAASAATKEGDHAHAIHLRRRAERLQLRARDLWRAGRPPLVLTEPRRERERRFGISGELGGA